MMNKQRMFIAIVSIIIVFCSNVTFADVNVIESSSDSPPKHAATMRCVYTTTYHFGILHNIYTCEISGQLQITKRNTEITMLEGSHTMGRKNDDVYGFKADAALIKYFPRGIDKIFNNLLAILINFSQLKEIRQGDLAPFTKLKYLDLFENKIEYIEADLFKFNTELETIWLSNNQIKFIDDNVFDNLRNLKSLFLGTNQCISRSVTDNPAKMPLFLDYIKSSCGSKSTNAKFAPSSDDDDDDDNKVDEKNEKLDESQKQIKQLNFKMQLVEDEVFFLKRKRENALIELTKYQDENANLKASMNLTKIQLQDLQNKLKKMDNDGSDYVRQITNLRNDMQRQMDSTDQIVTNFKDELTLLKESLTAERKEKFRLRDVSDRRFDENLKLHQNYEELMEKKKTHDLISMGIIFLLASVLIAGFAPGLYRRLTRGRARGSWNGVENTSMDVKMFNEDNAQVL